MATLLNSSKMMRKLPAILGLILLLPGLIQAGEERFNERLEGSELVVNASLLTKDDKYPHMVQFPNWSADFTNHKITNLITLRHMPEDNTYQGNVFSASVDVEITALDENHVSTVYNTTLTVTYDPAAGQSYQDRDVFRFFGGHQVTARITGITPTSGFPESLTLENEIIAERYYTFDPTVVPALTAEATPDGKMLQFEWNTVVGAEEYDLEWVLIEDYDETTGNFLAPNSLPFDFSRNATRVTTPNTSYQTPLVFEHGYILYRVRPVGRYAPDYDTRWEGIWSGNSTNGLVSAFGQSFHHTNPPESEQYNWGAQVVFAENGLQGFSMTFGDGLGRGRQSLSLLNTQGETMVGEAVFDHAGRQAVSILPVPAGDCSFDYRNNFNQDVLGNSYSKANFDLDPTSGCGLEADPLGTTSGAGRYYSSSNPDQDDQQAYVPDAGGYPMSQVEFMPDLTGRPKRAGGVGPDHQLGSGQEVKFYYADPSADELVRLFGSETGLASNYAKNIVVDPNGRSSVSYVDLAGNVVATSLLGSSPLGMNPLSSNAGSTQDTANLLNGNSPGINMDNMPVFESHITQYITEDGNHTFYYGLTPAFFADTCLPDSVCYDCVYDLEISIIDQECGTEMIAGGPYVTTIGQLPLNTECQDTTWMFEDSLELYLDEGTYNIRKTLTVSESAMDFYFNEYLEQDTCLLTYQDFYQTLLDSADFTGCEVDYCELNCLQSLGSEASFIANGGTVAEYQDLLNDCIEACYTENPCEQMRTAMMQDLSPGGQYALYQDTAGLTNVSLFPLSILNSSNQLPDGNAYWRTPFTPYLDEFGNPDSIEVNGVMVEPGHSSVTLAQFISSWNFSWAASLLPYHPEYCYLQWCDSNAASHAWDARFNNTYYFTEASDSGYFNPLNMSGSQGVPSGYTGTPLDPDPFFAPGGLGDSILNLAQNRMENFITIGSSTYSIWEISLISVYCPGISTAAEADTCLANSPAFGTDSCLNDLLWSTFQTNYQYLKRYYYDSLMVDYAIQGGCYNGCIGQQSFDPAMFSFDCYPITKLPECQSKAGNYGGFIDAAQPCDSTTYALYQNKLVHFPFPVPMDTASLAQTQSTITIMTDSLCLNTCQSMADAWMMALDPCVLDTADSAYIRAQFIEICQLGCLGGATQGSMTTPQDTASSDGFQSFEEVLDSLGYGNDSCAVWLISGPYGLDHNYSLVNTNLDTCGCSTILENHYNFNNNPLPAGVTTEVDLMLNDYGLLVPNLSSLVCLCDGAFEEGGGTWSSGANWPVEASLALDSATITVPYGLGCSECMYCDSFDVWLDSFAVVQPGMVDSTYYPQMLTNFLNFNLGYNLTPLEYINFSNWCNNVSGPAGDTLSLCNRSIYPEIGLDTINPCTQYLLTTVEYNAQQLWEDYKTVIQGQFEAEYKAHCSSVAGQEYFYMPFQSYEYHYTLYYYDQGGNLLRTVPPAGVQPLSNSEIAQAKQQIANNSGPLVLPSHTLKTEYRYNSFGGLIETRSPDGGDAIFKYDHLGRLVLSQNEEQENANPKKWSYTQFDDYGRIVEVGEIAHASYPDEPTLKDEGDLEIWMTGGTKTSITRTFYDKPLNTTIDGYFANGQANLRLRVATIAYYETDVADDAYTFATHYSYDQHGNVPELFQEIPALNYLGHDLKRLTYEYELFSGNVVAVHYQDGQPDAYHHRYFYDADNRLKSVETSRDQVLWTQDAKYHYYDHGPLARIETGENQVMGNDLVYTIHGWLKGINSNTLDPTRDQGSDGEGSLGTGSVHERFARDAAGFSLGYYEGDYTAISNPTTLNHFLASTAGTGLGGASTQLYNGNIGHMVTAIQGFAAQGTAYQYDQLNRLTSLRAYQNLDEATNSWGGAVGVLSDYATDISYDANGNITSLKRNGISSVNAGMDDFTYHYISGKNQLDHVDDDPTLSGFYQDDIDDQNGGNYQYNLIGQLIADEQEEIDLIEWTPYGKVKRITRTSASTKPDLEFHYDATGNRIGKTMKPAGSNQIDWETTWYALDASGTIMATYDESYADLGSPGAFAAGSFEIATAPKDSEIEVLINGVSVTGGTLVYSTEAATAAAVAAAINANSTYTAVANGAVVSVTAPAMGSSYNGQVISTTVSSTVPVINVVNLSGGIDPSNNYEAGLQLNEHHLYGSARVGVHNANHVLTTALFNATINPDGTFSNILVDSLGNDTIIDYSDTTNALSLGYGHKHYEFTNHLGNVLATVSDRKIAHDPNTDGDIDYFSADVLSKTDYYAFGMLMPGRKDSPDAYRFGFQEQENDTEVSGEGNSIPFKYRFYDPRLARFRSIDPLTRKYPMYSPYHFSSNQPIHAKELEGLESSDDLNNRVFGEFGVIDIVAAAVNGGGNLIAHGLEAAVTDAHEGGAIRYFLKEKGIIVPDWISDESLGENYALRVVNNENVVVQQGGVISDLMDVAGSLGDVAAVVPMGKSATLAGKGPSATSVLSSSKDFAELAAKNVPSVKNGQFSEWFNKLTPDEFDALWNIKEVQKKIKARLRSPGELHEWLMVSRAPQFKRWGVTAEQIHKLRTKIEEVKWINPDGWHGGPGSTAAHNEILRIIDNSLDFMDFTRQLNNWANYRLPGGISDLPAGLQVKPPLKATSTGKNTFTFPGPSGEIR